LEPLDPATETLVYFTYTPSISLSGRPYTVVGVLPSGFEFPSFQRAGLYLPHDRSHPEREERGNHFMAVFGRLAPGATVAQTQAELDTVAAQLRTAYPEANPNRGALMVPLQERLTKPMRTPLLLLFGAVIYTQPSPAPSPVLPSRDSSRTWSASSPSRPTRSRQPRDAHRVANRRQHRSPHCRPTEYSA
jgi:hypothetical protein